MNLQELFYDVFSKTKELLKPCVLGEENDQASHILYYLTLFAGYLSGGEEAEEFQKGWLEVKDDLNRISNFQDYMNQSYMLESHIEQAIRCESTHKPGDPRNIGIYVFYENMFQSLYKDAKEAKDSFWEGFEEAGNDSESCFDMLIEDEYFLYEEHEKDLEIWTDPD